MTDNRSWFLAKSPDRGAESIAEHTQALLKYHQQLMSVYGGLLGDRYQQLSRLAAVYHDLGKMNSVFQRFIYSKSEGKVPPYPLNLAPYAKLKGHDIPHGLLSAAFVDRNYVYSLGFGEADYYILVTAVSNHHTRSLDCTEKEETLTEVVNQDLKIVAKLYGLEFCNPVPLHKYNLFRSGAVNNMTLAQWVDYAMVKGLLNKVDYAASGHYERAEIEPVSAAELTGCAIEAKGYKLRDCQDYLLNNRGYNVVLRASTGMGKTEGSLLWADKAKTFYTLPYKVSINAIFERIRQEGYYPKDRCALLHSDAMSKLIELDDGDEYGTERGIRHKLDVIKNLSYPLTVCTVDQLFTCCYRAHGTELIAATLSYSSVIVDEIQAYEPSILAKILYGLKLIHMMGGKFLIMTATLPPFIEEYIKDFAPDVRVSQPFYTDMIRHVPKLVRGDFDYDVIYAAGQSKKVLVICNTVAKAQEVYSRLNEGGEGAYVKLLHSRFIRKHRAEKEREIMDFARADGAAGIWITTQLVEASLDIDFDLLYSQMSTADSLLQRMGRCYRGRKYDQAEPNVWVFDDGEPGIYDKDIYRRSVDCLVKYSGLAMSEQDKQQYIDEVYATAGIIGTDYYKKFASQLTRLGEIVNGGLRKEEAQKAFRDIVNDTVIPYKYAEEAANISRQIDSAKDFAERLRLQDEITQYTVQLNLHGKILDKATGKTVPKYRHESAMIGFYPVVLNDYTKEFGFLDFSPQGAFISDDF